MNVIGTELSQLSSHYLKKLLHLILFTFYRLYIYTTHNLLRITFFKLNIFVS